MSKIFFSLLSDFGYVPEKHEYFDSVDLLGLAKEIQKEQSRSGCEAKIKRGDVVQFSDMEKGKIMFDGKTLVPLEEYIDSSGTVPEEFLLNEFRDTRYFSNSITENKFIQTDFSGAKWCFLSSGRVKVTTDFGIYFISAKDGKRQERDVVLENFESGVFEYGENSDELIFFIDQ